MWALFLALFRWYYKHFFKSGLCILIVFQKAYLSYINQTTQIEIFVPKTGGLQWPHSDKFAVELQANGFSFPQKIKYFLPYLQISEIWGNIY